MIDFFPFPKKKKIDCPYRYRGLWASSDEYYDYHLYSDTLRQRIIRNAYNTFPMNISFVYSGIEIGEFILEDFYEDMGFTFEEKHTNAVHTDFAGMIKPTQVKKRKKFLIGSRKTSIGVQHAVLTPFFGEGQLTDNDIDVIASWVTMIL